MDNNTARNDINTQNSKEEDGMSLSGGLSTDNNVNQQNSGVEHPKTMGIGDVQEPKAEAVVSSNQEPTAVKDPMDKFTNQGEAKIVSNDIKEGLLSLPQKKFPVMLVVVGATLVLVIAMIAVIALNLDSIKDAIGLSDTEVTTEEMNQEEVLVDPTEQESILNEEVEVGTTPSIEEPLNSVIPVKESSSGVKSNINDEDYSGFAPE